MEMSETPVSVRLDIKSPDLLARFQSTLKSLQRVTIVNSQGAGLPDVVIMEIGSDFKSDLELIKSAQRSPSCPQFFLTSSHMSAEVLQQAMKMGIREFFSEPIEEAEVRAAFRRRKEYVSERAGKAQYGKVISVLGSRGGIGSTMIAVNLAVSLAQSGDDNKVALADLNLAYGDTSLFLNIEPVHTISEVAKNVRRLDPVLLMNILTRHPSGVYVLPPPNDLRDAESVTADRVEAILNLMREIFDHVVVDASRLLDPETIATLNISETVLLVTQLDLPAIKNAKRLLDLWSSLGYEQSKIKLIINRYQSRSDVSLEDAEKVLEQRTFWRIPNEYRSVMSSINQGTSLILTAHKSKLTKSLMDLAWAIQDKRSSNGEKRRFLFGPLRLMRRGFGK
jgi:pilus assembly protein CpaE